VARHERAVFDPTGAATERRDAQMLDAGQVADLDAPFSLPERIEGGWARVATFEYADDVVQGFYRADDTGAEISLFQQEGRLDGDFVLPADFDQREVDGQRVWRHSTVEGVEVVVVAH